MQTQQTQSRSKYNLLKNLFILSCIAYMNISCSGGSAIVLPGKTAQGQMRLSNGWFLTPAGTEIEVGDAPLNFDIDPSGDYAIVANNGEGEQTISIVGLQSHVVTQTIPVRNSWLGIKFYDDGKKFALSGGNDNRIFLYSFDQGRATLADSVVIGKPWPDEKIWLGGIDIADGRMYVTGKYDSTFYLIDLATKGIKKKLHLAGMPYTCLVSRNHPQIYISLWGSSKILVYDRDLLTLLGTIATGPHPSDMVESPDGKRLFVANANENTVSVVDIGEMKVTETISSALYPGAPAGSTPNSVALNKNGKILYIANADNNCLAVMDVATPNASKSLGFIPTGWYPSCVRVNSSDGSVIVANAKGHTSFPNPDGPVPGVHKPHMQYIGSLMKGSLEIITPPKVSEMAGYSTQVYANTPYHPAAAADSAAAMSNAQLFAPIKHVFYVLKENRTYDQVFGDMKEGNGDSSLAILGEKVTPNLHALARQFVLLDNFYVDAEVSADGHNWSLAAYATDFVEKTWPTQYGGHGGDYDFEPDNLNAAPTSGFLWDNCKAHNVTYRNYGELVTDPDKDGGNIRARVAALEGHTCPNYRGWDLDYSDLDREKVWEKELDAYEQNGDLPAFNLVYLPNDHTYGTSKGKGTPRSYVAQNDLAVGLFIERLSHSKYWKESAVFIIEDDAQNGSDHVDAHRSEALVISPYTKRGFADHTMYSTSGMVRTMEIILGLPPMTQYDAAAVPMANAFSADAVLAPFMHVQNTTDLGEKNLASAFGSEKSGRMDFSEPDEIDEMALNEIIWKSIRGVESELPAVRRGAWVMEQGRSEK